MRNTRSSVRAAAVAMILVLVGCLGCAPPTPTGLLMGPYVNRVQQDGAVVHWITEPNAPDQSLAVAGEAGSLRVQVSAHLIGEGQGLLHTAEITGLRPAATYKYVISDAKGKVEGAFQTAPPPGDAQPMRFIVYGDTRSDPNAHRAVMAAMKADLPVSFVINSGDFVANGTIWPLWKKEFFDPAADILRSTALWPVRGNHEQDANTYREIFDLPGADLYYSFDCGDLHVIVLDTGLEDGETPDANMVAWLEKDLATSKARWKMVSLHAPIFNLGGHASRWGQKEVLPLLEKYGVDLVIAGHSHLYERFAPIGPAGGKPIIHIVAGGGGAPLYDSRPSPLLESSHSVHHYCLFELQGDTLQMTAKTPDGKTLDTLRLVKTDGKYQPEIMKRAWDTREAEDVTFIISGFGVSMQDFPQELKPATATIGARAFPKGTEVSIGQADDGNWSVQPVRFVAGEDPVSLQVTPPPGFRFRDRGFAPGIKVSLTATYLGKTYTRGAVPVSLSAETIRHFTPEPVPSDVPPAPAAITIDGDLKDWEGVPPALVGPGKRPSKTVRFAWRPEGLYAAVSVEDSNVEISLKKPWEADSIEVFVESDYGRSFNAMKSPNAFKCEIFPRPDRPGNQAGVHGSYGRVKDDSNAIQAAWRRTPQGYDMEFLLPAAVLSPAKMEPGTKIGFHYALHDGPRTVEQFTSTKGKSGFWTTPIQWGALRLTGKP